MHIAKKSMPCQSPFVPMTWLVVRVNKKRGGISWSPPSWWKEMIKFLEIVQQENLKDGPSAL